MKTDLFEKLIRKIVREELEFYTSKIIKEVSEITSKNLVVENTNKAKNDQTVRYTSDNVGGSLKESLMGFKNELDKEYGMGPTMKFDGMDVPPELEKVFNKDYSKFIKK